MSFCRIAFACGAFLFVQTAWAAAPRESQERAARKACLLGDVAKGTEILADLYLDTKDPTHIYNQGRCYEQNGQNEQAVLRFREYLRKAEHLPPADVAAVEQKIAELQEKGRNAGAAVPPPLPPPTSATASQPMPPAASPPATTDPLQLSQASPVPAASTPVYKRWWFWTGVGVVAAGAVVTTLLLTSASEAKHSPPCAASGVTCVP
jgi:hypothetical protein